eukprot:scaffold374384_cov39-Prasinocladus_malaysianus.AAC.2
MKATLLNLTRTDICLVGKVRGNDLKAGASHIAMGSDNKGGPIYDMSEMEAELFPQKAKRNPLVLVGGGCGDGWGVDGGLGVISQGPATLAYTAAY